MEKINPNPIIKFNENQMKNVRKSVGYDDVGKLKQDLEQFEDWILKQNHFLIKKFDRGFLERFLIYNKGSIERAKQRLDKMCTFNNLMPEFLQNFDIRNEFHPVFAVFNTCVLPKPTPDNYRVIILNPTGLYDERWSLIGFYRYWIVLCEYMMFNDYCCGYELVADPTQMNFATVKTLNPLIFHKALTLIVEVLGQRMKKLHSVAGSKFFELIMNIVKQGLTEKLSKRLFIHPNKESLYEHIPREILPSDLGGEEKSMKELTDLNFKEMCTDEHIERVKYLESAKTDENLRLSGKIDMESSGMPGSFKTLCVD